jgi:MFS family permease
MTRFLIYLFPAIMDMILAAVFFMAQVYTAQRGASPSTVANFITTWAVVYMVSCFVVGRFVGRHNSARLIMLSCIVTTALSVAFALADAVPVMYLLVALEGIAMALFFVPFQVFMKQYDEGGSRSINSSVGLYTFSWSIGYATGPFAAAVVWSYVGWRGSHLINAGSALLVGVLTWLLQHEATARPQRPAAPPEAGHDGTGQAIALQAYDRMPDLAWMGWVFSGLGCLSVRMINGVFPSSAAACHLSKLDQGLTLFILSAVQACFGLLLGYFRWWMYRPLPILATGAAGIAGLWLFSTAGSAPAFYAAAAVFGLYSGTFFFYLVFHSLVHPEKSARYVAINEVTVGLTSLAGPFLGGLVATNVAVRTPYLMAAVLVLAGVTAQSALHAAAARRARARGEAAGAGPALTVRDVSVRR